MVQLAEAVVSLTSELQNENKELVKKDEEHQECLKTVEALKKSLKDTWPRLRKSASSLAERDQVPKETPHFSL